MFSLVCSEKALIRRMEADINQEKRTTDIIKRSLPRLKNYFNINSTKIDVSDISAVRAAEKIKQLIGEEKYGL